MGSEGILLANWAFFVAIEPLVDTLRVEEVGALAHSLDLLICLINFLADSAFIITSRRSKVLLSPREDLERSDLPLAVPRAAHVIIQSKVFLVCISNWLKDSSRLLVWRLLWKLLLSWLDEVVLLWSVAIAKRELLLLLLRRGPWPSRRLLFSEFKQAHLKC